MRRPVGEDHFWHRLGEVQARRTTPLLVVALLLLIGSIPLIMQLGLNSSFDALLPRDKPSIQDLERTRDRLGGLNQMTVAVLSKDTHALQRFAGDLVHALHGVKDPGIVSIEWNVATYEDFLYSHRQLYADVEDLERVRDRIDDRLSYERARANPLYVDLEDETPESPGKLVDELENEARAKRDKLKRYPGGFYIHPGGDLLALFVRTDLSGGDFEGTARLIEAIDGAVAQLGPTRYAPDLRVEYAGGLIHGQEEQAALKGELVLSTGVTLILVLGVIFVFFRRLRAIPVLALSLLVPIAMTFGFAELAVDYLNTSTAFLGSIILGNGVNPNIIWLARYFEERRAGQPVPRAIGLTHGKTWPATLTASLAAGTAYASLTLTGFRGFRDFGIIGGVGMLLCWLGAYLVLPLFVVLSERIRPLEFEPDHGVRNVYGRLCFWLVHSWPRVIVGTSAVLSVASVAVVAYALSHDPMEYDFRRLKSVREGSSRVTVLNRLVGEIVSSSDSGNAIAVLTNDHSDAVRVRDELVRRRDEQGAPYGKVRIIDDLLPTQQPRKIAILQEIRKLLLEVRVYASDQDRVRIDENLPDERITPLALQDLPEDVVRIFQERDGTRGRILYVENQPGGPSTWDGRYLIAWADSLRQVRLADGTRPPLAGRAPIFADMLEVVWADGPVAVGASLTATCILLLLSFRRWRERGATLFALLAGIAWMGAMMAAAGMRLNFLNFVAFPITCGNGADYGVNVMRRLAQEEKSGARSDGAASDGAQAAQALRAAIRKAVEESGGAVMLCSLTTIIGYASLYISSNRGLNSFGAAMAISELTCLGSALLTVPAFFWLRAVRQNQPHSSNAEAPGAAPPGRGWLKPVRRQSARRSRP